jgi:RHH-type proline utilization regulon transcriptional repressor/proline dehydrogenase/delta 1-pyrroline-5-carboxylate dehydrogenase
MERIPSSQEIEHGIRELGVKLYRRAVEAKPALFDARGLRGRLLARALEDELLRSALFQFIDVLPQLDSAKSIATHFRAYLGVHQLGGVWGRLLKLGEQPWVSFGVRHSVARLARQFLVEEQQAAFISAVRKQTAIPVRVTTDAVGEAVLTEVEAAAYLTRNLQLLEWLSQAGAYPPSLSIKLSALTPRFDPIDPAGSSERVIAGITPLMRCAIESGACLTIDMEHYELKPLTLQVFRALIESFPEGWLPGIAIQAYLPDSEKDLRELIAFAKARKRRITVRLVKGAYWDTEFALAQQRSWPLPVYTNKSETDVHYERLTHLLLDHADIVYPAFAGHNLRTLAHAVVAARSRNLPESAWEIHMLYVMAEPLQDALAKEGIPLRIYLPVGDLVFGIAYLIRRLLENTANTSILRQTYFEGIDVEQLLAAPEPPRSSTAEQGQNDSFTNIPLTDFSRDQQRLVFKHALDQVRSQLGRVYPLSIRGAPAAGVQLQSVINPADSQEILGQIELAGLIHAEQALKNAKAAFHDWRDMPSERRIELCLRAADIMISRRHELAAWEVLEVGKNWREADADVAEAADYFRYYSQKLADLGGWRETHDFPAESNHMIYEPRGVAVIISPWNFPLAILTGMTAAALVCGNTAIMKPAGPSQIISQKLLEILCEAGFPPDVCQLLPGRGGEIGDYFVCHPEVQIIAFTGSREVGLSILQKAHMLRPGQTHVKQVVCEMGGKNAIIVDEDADLDEAVLRTLHSAFGYQGQKCSAASRLIVVGRNHERVVARLSEALDCHAYGPPEDPQYVFGPLITREAQQRGEAYIEIGKREGHLRYRGKVPQRGFFFAPAIFTGIQPGHRLAREEIFAPILAVLHAENFDQAVETALDSDYALTGGVFSRYPPHLELSRARFRVGNLYLNRGITGALVGVQPFGGMRLSGTGVQAGGPDYLRQFMWTRVVSNNRLRHGLVPAAGLRKI